MFSSLCGVNGLYGGDEGGISKRDNEYAGQSYDLEINTEFDQQHLGEGGFFDTQQV